MTQANSSSSEKSRKFLWAALGLVLIVVAGSFFFDYGTLFRGFLGTEAQEKVLFDKEMEKVKEFVIATPGDEFSNQPIKTGKETSFEIQKPGKGTSYVGFLSDKKSGSWRVVKADFIAAESPATQLGVSVEDRSYAKFFSENTNIKEVCVTFGDGTSAECGISGKIFNHEYTAPGTYEIILEAKDEEGRSDRAAQNFVVAMPQITVEPTVDAKACTATVTGNTVVFKDNSTYSQPFNADEWTWRWYFDYGNNPTQINSNLQNPTYDYPPVKVPTSYTAYFEVKNNQDGTIADNNSCNVTIEPLATDSAQPTASINADFEIYYTTDFNNDGQNIYFYNKSKSANTEINAINSEFGDNQTHDVKKDKFSNYNADDTSGDLRHRFAYPPGNGGDYNTKDYNAKITVTDDTVSDTFTGIVSIEKPVRADATCRVKTKDNSKAEIVITDKTVIISEADQNIEKITIATNGGNKTTEVTDKNALPNGTFSINLAAPDFTYEVKNGNGVTDKITKKVQDCAAFDTAPTPAAEPTFSAPLFEEVMPGISDIFTPLYDPKAGAATGPVIDDSLKANFRFSKFETGSTPNTTIAVFDESSTSTPAGDSNPNNNSITKWQWNPGKEDTQFIEPTVNPYAKGQYQKTVKIQYSQINTEYQAEVTLTVFSDKGQSNPYKATITVPAATPVGSATDAGSSAGYIEPAIDAGSLIQPSAIDGYMYDGPSSFGGSSTFGAYLGADATDLALKTIDDFDYFIADSGSTVYFEAACTSGEKMMHVIPLSESDEGKAYDELVVAASKLVEAKAGIATLNITKGANLKCQAKDVEIPGDQGQDLLSDVTLACAVTPAEGYVNETAFLASGAGTTGTISGGYWDFMDGSASAKSEIDFKETPPITDAKHVYTKEGVYPVTLSVKDAKTNEILTCEKFVRVLAKPVDDGGKDGDGEKPDSIQSACSVDPVEGFVNETTFPFIGEKSTGPISDQYWDFGDGTFAYNSINAKHIYAEKGVYTVKLWLGDIKTHEEETCTLFVKVADKGEIKDEPKDELEDEKPKTTRCSDGIDNDADLYIDAKDPGCDNAEDDDESDGKITGLKDKCSDGIDNDGDKYIDFGADAGCDTPDDNDEYNAPLRKDAACSDEIDNDKDGFIDLKDPGCEDSKDNDETNAEEKLKEGGAVLPYCLKPVNPKIYVDLGEVENKAVVHEESSAGYDGKDKDFVGDPIFEGYDDKGERVFRPFAPIGRDEAVKTALLTTCYMDHLIKEDELSKKAVPFEDPAFANKDYWAKDLIYIGANSGLLEKKDKFHPHDQVTRAEFLKLLLEIYTDINNTKVPACTEKTKIDFVDVTKGDWFCGYAIYAKQLGISVGFKDSKGNLRLNPNKVLTRIDAAIMLWNYYISTTEKKSFLDVEQPIKKPILR